MKKAVWILCCGAWLAIHGPVLADSQADYQNGFEAYIADDLLTAMQLLERAADKGHTDAMVLLGYIFDKAGEDAQAVAIFQRAAKQGSAAAELALAEMYAAGEGVDMNRPRALRLLRSAAGKGHAPALLRLGEAYLSGELGLSTDKAKAKVWLAKAAGAGSKEAANKLKILQGN